MLSVVAAQIFLIGSLLGSGCTLGSRGLLDRLEAGNAAQRTLAHVLLNFSDRASRTGVSPPSGEEKDDDGDDEDKDEDDEIDSLLPGAGAPNSDGPDTVPPGLGGGTPGRPRTPLPPLPPRAPLAPMAPLPPMPPMPPMPPGKGFSFQFQTDDGRELPRFSETARNVPAVEVLHRIARTAGWSMTLVGVGRDKIDVDLKDEDPRDALRKVLELSHCMGVLRRDRLVVIPSPEEQSGGMLIEKRDRRRATETRKSSKSSDMVKVFQGDLTVPSGTVLQGDAVAIWGNIEIEQGAVVQGSVASIGGSVNVDPGGVVLGDGVAVLGDLDVQRGGQILGEHVQVGLGKLLRRHSSHGSGILSSLGPFSFGLFPTLALFSLIYLVGLGVLRLSPDRVRGVGVALFRAPLRSFFIGFVCWLLVFPLGALLAISVVGIPLVPLLPLMLFVSIALGLSAVALRVGETLPAGPGQTFVPPAALGMGMAVLLLVSFVPWLGTPVLALAQFLALGAAVSSRYGKALPPA